jgi:RimJ/RimL family protein N-acetyltransferase
VCWCIAEYVSDGRCGMGIETIPQYQNRGLATLAARAVAAECDARNITAHWDSWKDNHPSVRVAEKLGFELVGDY